MQVIEHPWFTLQYRKNIKNDVVTRQRCKGAMALPGKSTRLSDQPGLHIPRAGTGVLVGCLLPSAIVILPYLRWVTGKFPVCRTVSERMHFVFVADKVN